MVDVSTGEDLTSVTLAQIILGERAEPPRRASRPRSSTSSSSTARRGRISCRGTMKSSLDAIMTSQREADRVFREWASRAGWAAPSKVASPAGPSERKVEASGEADVLSDEVAALREYAARARGAPGEATREVIAGRDGAGPRRCR